MKGGCNFPMGPLALLDLVGLDTSLVDPRRALRGVPRSELRRGAAPAPHGHRRPARPEVRPRLLRLHAVDGPHATERANRARVAGRHVELVENPLQQVERLALVAMQPARTDAYPPAPIAAVVAAAASAQPGSPAAAVAIAAAVPTTTKPPVTSLGARRALRPTGASSRTSVPSLVGTARTTISDATPSRYATRQSNVRSMPRDHVFTVAPHLHAVAVARLDQQLPVEEHRGASHGLGRLDAHDPRGDELRARPPARLVAVDQHPGPQLGDGLSHRRRVETDLGRAAASTSSTGRPSSRAASIAAASSSAARRSTTATSSWVSRSSPHGPTSVDIVTLRMPVEPPPTPWALPARRPRGRRTGSSASAPTSSPARCSPPTGPARSRCPSAAPGRWAGGRPTPAGVIPLDGLRVCRLAAPVVPAVRGPGRHRLRRGRSTTCADPRRPRRLDHRRDRRRVRASAPTWAGRTASRRGSTTASSSAASYGVAIGGLFAGESMFHRRTDASKVALVGLVELLRAGGARRCSTCSGRPTTSARSGAVEIPRAPLSRAACADAVTLAPPHPFAT